MEIHEMATLAIKGILSEMSAEDRAIVNNYHVEFEDIIRNGGSMAALGFMLAFPSIAKDYGIL